MSISISNRILLGFAAILLLMFGLGAYAVVQLGDIHGTTQTIVERDLAMARSLGSLREDLSAMRTNRDTAMMGLLATATGRTPPDAADAIAAWSSAADATEARLTEAVASAGNLRNAALSPDRADVWRQIVQELNVAGAAFRELRAGSEQQIRMMRASDIDGALVAIAALAPSRARFTQAVDKAEDLLDRAIVLGQQRAGDVYENSRISIAVAIALATLLGLAITVALRRSIAGPLDSFVTFVERIGRGDLSGEMAATGRDEIGRLGTTLNAMVDGLRQLARQSRDATENLNASAAEIRASMQEQAASVEEQLAAVQETAATVDEITHAGAQIGKRAQEVIAAAQATAQTSTAGLQAVDETARAMDSIREQAEAVAQNIVSLSEKTQAIGEIITTVNDISERSHLLALNAAIEAAAAGESGRSFAVVASEMKLLADQAKEATNQVRSILGDVQRGINSSVMLTEEAVKRVAAGKERTDTTQRTIDEITGRIQESVQTFQQIVASTNQQQLGIEQVMSALQNIRQASQQTAAGTRQLDQAAANLSTLSQQLLLLAERYRL